MALTSQKSELGRQKAAKKSAAWRVRVASCREARGRQRRVLAVESGRDVGVRPKPLNVEDELTGDDAERRGEEERLGDARALHFTTILQGGGRPRKGPERESAMPLLSARVR